MLIDRSCKCMSLSVPVGAGVLQASVCILYSHSDKSLKLSPAGFQSLLATLALELLLICACYRSSEDCKGMTDSRKVLKQTIQEILLKVTSLS